MFRWAKGCYASIKGPGSEPQGPNTRPLRLDAKNHQVHNISRIIFTSFSSVSFFDFRASSPQTACPGDCERLPWTPASLRASCSCIGIHRSPKSEVHHERKCKQIKTPKIKKRQWSASKSYQRCKQILSVGSVGTFLCFKSRICRRNGYGRSPSNGSKHVV